MYALKETSIGLAIVEKTADGDGGGELPIARVIETIAAKKMIELANAAEPAKVVNKTAPGKPAA